MLLQWFQKYSRLVENNLCWCLSTLVRFEKNENMKKAFCICENSLSNNHPGTPYQFEASISINNINDNEIQDESTIIDLRPVIPGLMSLSMIQSQSIRTSAEIGVSTTSIYNMK